MYIQITQFDLRPIKCYVFEFSANFKVDHKQLTIIAPAYMACFILSWELLIEYEVEKMWKNIFLSNISTNQIKMEEKKFYILIIVTSDIPNGQKIYLHQKCLKSKNE